VSKRSLEIRAYFIHMTHYDPKWCERKAQEKPFDVDVALEIVEAMAKHNMNLLLVDCEDGVAYKSHPELKRHYTVPMSHLRKLSDAARAVGVDVVPKLNFAKSGRNMHDDWMRPHSHPIQWMRDQETYWKVAEDVVGELVEACRPKRYFHIGMDEDHYRSVRQYVRAIKILRRMLKKHCLRPIIWNDSCHHKDTAGAQVHADKCRAAEELLPHDIVQMLWDYRRAWPSIARRVAERGFEVWAAPGRTVQNVRRWRKAVQAANRRGGGGLLLSPPWMKCCKSNRKAILNTLKVLAPASRP